MPVSLLLWGVGAAMIVASLVGAGSALYMRGREDMRIEQEEAVAAWRANNAERQYAAAEKQRDSTQDLQIVVAPIKERIVRDEAQSADSSRCYTPDGERLLEQQRVATNAALAKAAGRGGEGVPSDPRETARDGADSTGVTAAAPLR